MFTSPTLNIDIDSLVHSAQQGGLFYCLDQIRKADTRDIVDLLKAVRKHQKGKQIKYCTAIIDQGYHNQNPYDAYIVPAIKFELRKRAWVGTPPGFLKMNPIQEWWIGFWRGADVKTNEYLGDVLVFRTSGRTTLEWLGLRKVLIDVSLDALDYIKKNFWNIITGVGTLIGGVAAWIAISKK